MHAMFIEASEKLGVDPETLAMMAISGFLNSPLVSGGLDEEQTIASERNSQASESEIVSLLVNADDMKEDESILDGMRNSDIDFSKVATQHVDLYCDEGTILWGQFSRFLPIKVSLRILASITQYGSPVTIDSWLTSVFDWTPPIRMYLQDVDKENRIPRGEQFSSGFPKGAMGDEGIKSIQRYWNHSCACIYSDGTIVGLPAHLGLIHVEEGDEWEQRLVSLTQEGLEYVAISNPMIDEGSVSMSMSREETEFMISRIQEVLPSAWGFLRFVLSSVAEGADTPTELSEAITSLYGNGTSRNWNDKQVPTYRTGAIGLLGEMSLISRTWNFRSVTYSVTDKGKEVLSQ